MSVAVAININRLMASETSSTGVAPNRTFDSPIAHTECEIRVQTGPCHKPQNMTPLDRPAARKSFPFPIVPRTDFTFSAFPRSTRSLP
ncbi:hypothetical protein ASA1KI_07350 [Opitutales bacterium ASA1]|nr:hypothetical protein ASA1KI_07350 [Opitutales bacterium ASA1]